METDCRHPASCQCAIHGTPVSQSIDELGFLKSACSAAQSGDLARLDRLITAHPDALHTDGVGGTSGYTPLHYAARAGQVEALRLLLQRGTHSKDTPGRPSPCQQYAEATDLRSRGTGELLHVCRKRNSPA